MSTARRQNSSLARRLIVAASLWSAAALVLGAVILTALYRQSVEAAFDDRLNVSLQAVIGAIAAQGEGELQPPDSLGEQQFEQLYSGWYWQVTDPEADGEVVIASPSLFSDSLDPAAITGRKVEDGVMSGSLVGPGPDDQSLRVRGQMIVLTDGRSLDVMVAGDASVLNDRTWEFATSVALTLAVFGIGLIVATTVQIRWGLRPLDRIRQRLADMRAGREARFEGPFPSEIAPLAQELNAVLESNQKVIQRARTQVGNLAHALKTPLSVVVNEGRALNTPAADKIVEQAELMGRQISHHLDRARIAAQSDVIGVLTDIAPAVERMARVMNRLNEDRGVSVTASAPADLKFRGEQQDLEEIVGNLVDNATKWASSRVVITVTHQAAVDDDGEDSAVVIIEDDGPGLTEEQRREVTVRGRRLDETKPGSGLGLSIVTDLIDLYDGGFSLSRAEIGGLRAEVTLPAQA